MKCSIEISHPFILIHRQVHLQAFWENKNHGLWDTNIVHQFLFKGFLGQIGKIVNRGQARNMLINLQQRQQKNKTKVEK